jgi:hypothetical protein
MNRRKLFLTALLALVLVWSALGVAVSADSGAWMRVRFLRVLVNQIVDGTLAVTGTSTFTGAVTATSGLAGDVTGDVTGDVSGNVTGDLTGDVTGNVTGDVSGATGVFTTSVTSPSFVGDLSGSASGATGAFTTSVTTPILASNVAVTGTLDVQGGAITLQNDETIGNAVNGTIVMTADNVDVSGDMVVSLFGRFERQAPIEATAGGTITPTGTYQPITSTGNIGLSDLVPTTAGDLLILINESDTTITITDTATTMLSGNIALGQYDSLTLFCDGTNWVELATTNN